MVTTTANKILSFKIFIDNSLHEFAGFEKTELNEIRLYRNESDGGALDILVSIECKTVHRRKVLGIAFNQSHQHNSKALFKTSYTLTPIENVHPDDIFQTVQFSIDRLQQTINTIYHYDKNAPIIPSICEDDFADKAFAAYSHFIRVETSANS